MFLRMKLIIIGGSSACSTDNQSTVNYSYSVVQAMASAPGYCTASSPRKYCTRGNILRPATSAEATLRCCRAGVSVARVIIETGAAPETAQVLSWHSTPATAESRRLAPWQAHARPTVTRTTRVLDQSVLIEQCNDQG